MITRIAFLCFFSCLYAMHTQASALKVESIRIKRPESAAPAPLSIDPQSGNAEAEEEFWPEEQIVELPIPNVSYDLEDLPLPVAQARERLWEIARSADFDALRAVFAEQTTPPYLGPDQFGAPTEFLRESSGDGEGLEILAIMQDILQAGFVIQNAGSADERYVWPYFAQYPLDKLKPAQLVEMYRIVTAADYFEMQDYGRWTFYQLTFNAQGEIVSFSSGY